MTVTLLVVSLLFAACLAGPVPINQAEENAILALEKKVPKVKPLRTRVAAEKDVMDQILEANNELNLFEGDIPGVSANARNAIRDVAKLWTSREIPYVINTADFSASEISLINQAMEEYHLQTCLTFVPRTNQPDYIHIKRLTGCWSGVGVQGGEQDVSFGSGCIHKGIMMHELMHAVGFWHEQSRSDRDDWVVIQWENIQDGKAHNFNKYSQTEVDSLGAPYDYGSVMHYSATSFSKSGLPTIVPRVPTDTTLGQRNGFSAIDLQKINQLYSCNMPVGWSEWSAWSPCDDTCTMTRRRFCSDPAGCTGQDTQTQTCPWPCLVGVHPDCGNPFMGGPSGEIKSPMHPQNYHDFLNCQWLINATGPDPITVSFKEFSVESAAGCPYDVLKVYDGPNENAPLLGSFCGEDNPQDFTSSGDRMFITFSSDSSYNQRGFVIEYTSVPLLTDCDFSSDMCGFSQDTSDNFDWTRHQGSTPSGQTGPLTDHTTGTGYYMFIEASSPQDTGHKAVLRSPIYPPSPAGYCLDFYYHMYGTNVGDLNVYVFTGVNREADPDWSMSGNQGNQWLRARVTIKHTSNFMLMIEAVRGSDWRGDIAIDDIKVFSHPCA